MLLYRYLPPAQILYLNLALALVAFSGPIAGATAANTIAVNPVSSTISFIPNHGQWPDSVLYRTSVPGAVAWVLRDGLVYQITREFPTSEEPAFSKGAVSKIEQQLIRARFLNSPGALSSVGIEPLGYPSNFFLGDDPTTWATDVPSYREILIEEIYSGIDLRLYSSGGSLKYDLVVEPGADPEAIRIGFDTSTEISLATDGSLQLTQSWARFSEAAPLVYQEEKLGRQPIEARFQTIGAGVVGFEIGDYNRSSELVIDPTLVFSSYLGGSGHDQALDLAVDDAGNTYVTGYTLSLDFPAGNSNAGNRDVFITKLSTTGGGIIYSGYLGGSQNDEGSAVAINAIGNAFIAGETSSTNYPTAFPFATDMGERDGFVTKINTAGNGLLYSTYFGGSERDYCNDIAVAEPGIAYITGATSSPNLPVVNAFQATQPAFTSSFVAKFNFAGSALDYSTYLGQTTTGLSELLTIAIDNSGYAYLAGYATASSFPTVNPVMSYQAGNDVVITKLDSDGDSLLYSTFYGGSASDVALAIAVDEFGAAYVTGQSSSSNLPLVNSVQGYADSGEDDIFVVKLNPAGSAWEYSTYLGGGTAITPPNSSGDRGFGIAVKDGEAWITGVCRSTDFPLVNPLSTFFHVSEVAVVQLHRTGNPILFSTVLGDSSGNGGNGIAIDTDGDVFVAGYSLYNGFPEVSAVQSWQGGDDGIVFRISASAVVCGDADGNGTISISDAVYIINFVFGGGPPPNPLLSADADCSQAVSIGDAVYIINFIFSGGPAPCATCP